MNNKETINILRRGYPDINRYAASESEVYEYDVETYNEAVEFAIKLLEEPEKPQVMTNGDKLLSVFDKARMYGVCVDNFFASPFDLDWWDSAYKESEEENEQT